MKNNRRSGLRIDKKVIGRNLIILLCICFVASIFKVQYATNATVKAENTIEDLKFQNEEEYKAFLEKEIEKTIEDAKNEPIVNSTEETKTTENLKVTDVAIKSISAPTVEKKPIVNPLNDYSKTASNHNKNKYYDLIHLRASEIGIAPNKLASMMALESSGNAKEISDVDCKGLFQISEANWKRFVGIKYKKLDGSYGTITALNNNNSNKVTSGNIFDPEANSFVGSRMLKENFDNCGNNMWIAYGIHNGGWGFAEFIAKYSDKSLGNISFDEIQNIIHSYAKKISHGYNGETDKALVVLNDIYNSVE